MRLVLIAPGDVLEQVDVGRPLEAARLTEHRHLALDAREPEAARLVAVAIVPDHVPAAAPRQHAPRLEGAQLGRARPGLEVGKRHRTGVAGRLEQHRQRRFGGIDVRGRPRRAARVDVGAAGPQLDQRVAGRLAERGRLPEPGRDADRRRLGGIELDRRQLVLAAHDPVAVVGIEGAVAPGLQRHAEIAQLGLVALEHPLERLVGALGPVGGLVPGNRLPDPLGAEELPGREQADNQVDQPFGPPCCHISKANPCPGRAGRGARDTHRGPAFALTRPP